MADTKKRNTRRKTTVLTRQQESGLSSGINKLSDAIGELVVNMATHQERLDNVDKRTEGNATDIQRLETSQQQIHERITTVQQDLSEKMQAQTEHLKQHLDNSVGKIEALVQTADKKREDGDKAILERVSKLEIWRWLIVGGAMVGAVIMSGIIWKIVAAVIDKIDWVKFFGG